MTLLLMLALMSPPPAHAGLRNFCSRLLSVSTKEDPYPYADETTERLLLLNDPVSREVRQELQFRLDHDMLSWPEKLRVLALLGKEAE